MEMKKIGTLALTLALAGSLTVPALAAEETAVPISADTGYGTALVLNGETLDLTGIPGVEGGTLLPLRLLAEADHGSAYWDEENNESWFYFGDNRITVKFADNSVWVDDEQVKSQVHGHVAAAWPWWAASPLSPPTCLTAGRATR